MYFVATKTISDYRGARAAVRAEQARVDEQAAEAGTNVGLHEVSYNSDCFLRVSGSRVGAGGWKKNKPLKVNPPLTRGR